LIVFQDSGMPLVYRFYTAFKEAKQGRGQYVEELEKAMFAVLGVALAGGAPVG
jgi:hypothetical protein